ncbi:MAG: lytic transglycosylase domain-containing protein [Deltaproteobacteria bacterium]|nr:lytic transglycosylase domain-containing protein [Deltaproteobacteria bacterium]
MSKLKIATILAFAAMLASKPALSQTAGRFDEPAMLSAIGTMYGLDPALLEAIAIVESDGNPSAVSSAGALGLMQLMPATAQRFLADEPMDPVENALAAARFLDYLKGNGQIRNLPDLLAAYNAGEGAVERYHGIPPYSETREYVRRVLWLYLLRKVPPASGYKAYEAGHNNKTTRVVECAGTRKRRGPKNGDSAVLDQLAEVKRQRALAVAASSGDVW